LALKGQRNNPGRNHQLRNPVHSACIFKTDEEQREAVASFLFEGLSLGEKCLYVLDGRTKDDVVDSLSGRGDVQKAVDEGQVTFLDRDDAYLMDGRFDPDSMLGLIRRANKSAKADGFNGFRATGEMSWHKAGLPGSDRLMEYEARVNFLNAELGSSFLCQYHEPSFDSSTLIDVLHTHPRMVIRGERCVNPYFVSPEDFIAMRAGRTPREVYEKRILDILKRARLSLIHRMELRDLRSARSRLDAIETSLIPDMQSLAEVACFYADLARDGCSDPSTLAYIEEIAKNCQAMQSRLSRSADRMRTDGE
jgi:hypothetical protein